MSRQDQHAISLLVDGEDYGIWDKRTGGNRTADSTKYRPGRMGPPRSLGGWADTENNTLERLFDLSRDHESGLARNLRTRVGKARCVISDQPLDINGVPVGQPDVYTGTLVGYMPPEKDSESNDAALVGVEIEVDGEPG